MISIQNLTLGYGNQPAVLGLEAEIFAGSLTAIIGPNGAGKSTLLKGIMGTLLPIQGKIKKEGLTIYDIAYLPQQQNIDLTFPISVIDLVSMGLWKETGPFGGFKNSHVGLVKEAIAAVGLTGLEHRTVSNLSGGQLQRMLFARLLLQDAKLILLDEPFTAIDSKTMADLIEVIQDWHGEGRTIIAVLHDHEIVRSYFPQTLMLARELISHGPTEQVINPKNQILANQMCEACATIPHTCGKEAA